MLVIDDQRKAQIQAENRIDAERERYKHWVDAQLEHKVYIDGGTVNIADPQRQMGQVIMPDVFEARCRKLLPTLWTCVNPKNPAIRAMYARTPPRDVNGNPMVTDLIISPYPNGPLPEWSIFNVEKERVPDWRIYGDHDRKHVLDARDMPKDPDAVKPGWTEIKRPGMEVYRGWRTVLAYMVARGHAKPDAVEREFGAGDRLSWATHMGRREGSPF